MNLDAERERLRGLALDEPDGSEIIRAYIELERLADVDMEDEAKDAYSLGARDGFHDCVQLFDLATGGDGEFKGSTAPGETVDVPAMIARILERNAAAAHDMLALIDAQASALAEVERQRSQWAAGFDQLAKNAIRMVDELSGGALRNEIRAAIRALGKGT